jgi:hypothetical protein
VKTCRKCGQDKPLGDFYKDARGRGGLSARCKPCVRTVNARWSEENPDRVRTIAREAYRRQRAARLEGVARTCEFCKGEIPTERSAHAKYCSERCCCSAAYERRREEMLDKRAGRLCDCCGTEIPITRTLKATTCSTKCRDALNEGKLMRIKCRQLSLYAVKVGRLVKQPCEVCGDEKVEIHHSDYFDPLNVRWLCFVHHRNLMHGTSIEEGARSYGSAR